MKGIEEYKKNVNVLIDATINNKIIWKQQNPTTYYFVSTTTKGNTSLTSIQSINDSFGGDYVQLNITNSSTKENVLVLTSFQEGLEGNLEKLLDVIEYQIEKKGIDYFNDLIDNL